jgi:hypothetical protein
MVYVAVNPFSTCFPLFRGFWTSGRRFPGASARRPVKIGFGILAFTHALLIPLGLLALVPHFRDFFTRAGSVVPQPYGSRLKGYPLSAVLGAQLGRGRTLYLFFFQRFMLWKKPGSYRERRVLWEREATDELLDWSGPDASSFGSGTERPASDGWKTLNRTPNLFKLRSPA